MSQPRPGDQPPRIPTAASVAAELEAICADMTPIERVLVVAEALREVYPGEWKIEARSDGSFTIFRKPD